MKCLACQYLLLKKMSDFLVCLGFFLYFFFKKSHGAITNLVILQIAELFNKLSDPGFFACPVHQDAQLHISQNYPMIISTPHALLQYDIRLLSPVKTVIIDEADLIIANGGRALWKLLQSFKENCKLGRHYNSSVKEPIQFLFAAATFPQQGEKSVFRKVMNWLPDIVYIKSSLVHQFVPTVQFFDVFMEEEEKLPQLLRCLNVLSGNLTNSDDCSESKTCEKGENLFTRSQEKGRDLRILVFVNTVKMARNIFEFLNCEEGEAFKVFDKKLGSGEDDYVCQHKINRNHIESWISDKTEALAKMFSTKTGSSAPWKGKVGLLHKELAMLTRQEVLQKFKRSEIVVLVSTDLASRGLDILDISHVIQLDYAHNATDVLHRAGRTARAGAKGTGKWIKKLKDSGLLKVSPGKKLTF